MRLIGISSLWMPLLLASCAAPVEQFRPTTGARAQSRSGEPAAAYTIRDDGNRVAEVKVWSQGAGVAQDGSATLVHAALEVQNVGTQAITLDIGALELEAFDAGGAPLGTPRLVTVQPPGPDQRPIAQATAADLDLLFALDPRVAPADIGSLRLRWLLQQPDGRRYVQFTDFRRDELRTRGSVYAYVPIYGFYDPFFLWPPPYPRVIIYHHVPVRRVYVVPRHHHWR